MAKFDLSQYATVEERLKAFWANENSKDARIVTINHTIDTDLWVIETRLYLNAEDQEKNLPKTTGWASEKNTDAFALERCETSSIGRCLANYIYSGSKRPSREEMTKVQRMGGQAQTYSQRPSSIATEKQRIYIADLARKLKPPMVVDIPSDLTAADAAKLIEALKAGRLPAEYQPGEEEPF